MPGLMCKQTHVTPILSVIEFDDRISFMARMMTQLIMMVFCALDTMLEAKESDNKQRLPFQDVLHRYDLLKVVLIRPFKASFGRTIRLTQMR